MLHLLQHRLSQQVMKCSSTFGLLLVVACDLSHILLEASGQGVASTLGVSLGLKGERFCVMPRASCVVA